MGATGNRGRGIAAQAGKRIRHSLVAGLGLFALALVSGSLGNLSRALNGALAVGALSGLAILWRRQRQQVARGRLARALALLIVSLPVVARGEPLGLLGVVLFLFGFSLLFPENEGLLTALLLTGLLFSPPAPRYLWWIWQRRSLLGYCST